jgi:hypothetical protein
LANGSYINRDLLNTHKRLDLETFTSSALFLQNKLDYFLKVQPKLVERDTLTVGSRESRNRSDVQFRIRIEFDVRGKDVALGTSRLFKA